MNYSPHVFDGSQFNDHTCTAVLGQMNDRLCLMQASQQSCSFDCMQALSRKVSVCPVADKRQMGKVAGRTCEEAAERLGGFCGGCRLSLGSFLHLRNRRWGRSGHTGSLLCLRGCKQAEVVRVRIYRYWPMWLAFAGWQKWN